MKPSSAAFIAYNLRPVKQAERRLMLDFLKCVGEVLQGLTPCRYVGLGGTMFYDFHLIHRFLGIDDMISLERDSSIYPRCKFNRPFDFIKVKNETISEFLASDTSPRRTIYWFDYDDGISPNIAADITALGTRVQPGGFAFVTTYASAPGMLEKQTPAQRLEYFHAELGELTIGFTADDMQNSKFPETIHRMLMKAFSNAFAARHDGQFLPLFQVEYKDTAPMVTVGGCFSAAAIAPRIRAAVNRALPFLARNPPYKLRHLNLTERERVLFDMAVTRNRKNSKPANALRELGFKPSQLEAYKDLIRFLPRYHESIF